MKRSDSYGRRWPVRQMVVDVGRFSIQLECVERFDDVLDSFVASDPDNTEMIPYFADLWPSALALARYLQDRFKALDGMRVIELGCGLGVPSMVAALLGGAVTASDFHPDNLPYLRANAVLNGLGNLMPVCMDWRHPAQGECYDVVLGSDLLYEKGQVETLVTCIKQILRTGGTLLLADPVRPQLQAAFDCLRANGLAPELLVVDELAIIEACNSGKCMI